MSIALGLLIAAVFGSIGFTLGVVAMACACAAGRSDQVEFEDFGPPGPEGHRS